MLHATGLDLDEHERSAVERDQVDLAVAGALVAPERGEAQAVQVLGGQLLAAAAERVARIGAPGVSTLPAAQGREWGREWAECGLGMSITLDRQM